MSKNNVEQMPLPLADESITVHCFFGCLHIVQSADPQTAHDFMEQHYTEKHSRKIDRIVYRWKGKK